MSSPSSLSHFDSRSPSDSYSSPPNAENHFPATDSTTSSSEHSISTPMNASTSTPSSGFGERRYDASPPHKRRAYGTKDYRSTPSHDKRTSSSYGRGRSTSHMPSVTEENMLDVPFMSFDYFCSAMRTTPSQSSDWATEYENYKSKYDAKHLEAFLLKNKSELWFKMKYEPTTAFLTYRKRCEQAQSAALSYIESFVSNTQELPSLEVAQHEERFVPASYLMQQHQSQHHQTTSTRTSSTDDNSMDNTEYSDAGGAPADDQILNSSVMSTSTPSSGSTQQTHNTNTLDSGNEESMDETQKDTEAKHDSSEVPSQTTSSKSAGDSNAESQINGLGNKDVYAACPLASREVSQALKISEIPTNMTKPELEQILLNLCNKYTSKNEDKSENAGLEGADSQISPISQLYLSDPSPHVTRHAIVIFNSTTWVEYIMSTQQTSDKSKNKTQTHHGQTEKQSDTTTQSNESREHSEDAQMSVDTEQVDQGTQNENENLSSKSTSTNADTNQSNENANNGSNNQDTTQSTDDSKDSNNDSEKTDIPSSGAQQPASDQLGNVHLKFSRIVRNNTPKGSFLAKVAPYASGSEERVQIDLEQSTNLAKMLDKEKGLPVGSKVFSSETPIPSSDNPNNSNNETNDNKNTSEVTYNIPEELLAKAQIKFSGLTPKQRLDVILCYLTQVHFVSYYMGIETMTWDQLWLSGGVLVVRAPSPPVRPQSITMWANKVDSFVTERLQTPQLAPSEPKTAIIKTYYEQLSESLYHCNLCSKNFYQAQFVELHLEKKHEHVMNSPEAGEHATRVNYERDPHRCTPSIYAQLKLNNANNINNANNKRNQNQSKQHSNNNLNNSRYKSGSGNYSNSNSFNNNRNRYNNNDQGQYRRNDNNRHDQHYNRQQYNQPHHQGSQQRGYQQHSTQRYDDRRDGQNYRRTDQQPRYYDFDKTSSTSQQSINFSQQLELFKQSLAKK